jgi:glycosyltransferase involved in cell wall biosynthesis
MKVLTLCYEYPPVGGGGGRMAHQVGAALVARGHAVRVQTVRMPDLPAFEIRDGVEIFRTAGFRRRADLCTVPEMLGFLATSFLPSLRHIRAWKPDVVHAHFAVPTGALALACKVLTGAPYVLTAHLGDLPGGNPDQTAGLFRVLNPLIRPIWSQAAGVSASSSFAAGLARTSYGVQPQIILNGISMSGKLVEARPPSAPLELVAIGRFNPQKNFPWLISALGGSDVPWNLSLIGDGTQRGEIEALIQKYRLADRVRLLGWVPEATMREVLEKSDILLMPSTSEGNPVAAIEALKPGVAILGSDIGGLTDLIENGKNGFAVPIQTSAAFLEKLAWMADHPEAVHRMKSHSLEVANRFDLDAIAADFESLLARQIRKK